jgi:hypothetical protein
LTRASCYRVKRAVVHLVDGNAEELENLRNKAAAVANFPAPKRFTGTSQKGRDVLWQYSFGAIFSVVPCLSCDVRDGSKADIDAADKEYERRFVGAPAVGRREKRPARDTYWIIQLWRTPMLAFS